MLIGICSAGVFTDKEIKKEGVVVGIISSDEMEVYGDVAEGLSKDMVKAGKKLAKQFADKISPSDKFSPVLILLPDGVTNTVGDLVLAVYDILGSHVKYVGGGAGDNLRFIKTYQFLNDKVYTDAVVAVLIKSKNPIGIYRKQ